MNTLSALQKAFFLSLPAFLIPFTLAATHNRAGEIHIRQIGPLTIEATVITWTKASSTTADRNVLEVSWGDGSRDSVWRSNGGGAGVILPNDIKYNEYVYTHTYAGPATYRISITDQNRIAGIVNVNPPSSDQIPFHVATIYTFQDLQFNGTNTTPYLRQPPIDNACIGKPFRHFPGAYDEEGDSLSYQFIVPLQATGSVVPNYSYPNQIGSGANNSISIDERTGEILWLSPQIKGEYNIAFIIVSWRNGTPIDTTIRDMQIFVDNCKNDPPVVQTIDKICVIAGDTVRFEVSATDPQPDSVQLEAFGGPLPSSLQTIKSPASFKAPGKHSSPPVKGVFTWPTVCEHISAQPYTVVFRASDSLRIGSVLQTSLSDLKRVEIKVVGPPPTGLGIETNPGEVSISWDKPYACEGADDKYFYGFAVWRREGSNPFPFDSCMTGLEGKGYTEIVFVTRQMKDGRYYFKDTKVQRGRTYCYRIVAKFARLSTGGYPYNIVESLPSEEICTLLPRDLPLITNVSIENTAASGGSIEVRWSKPVAKDLDTLLNKGPYRYQLKRADGFSGGTLQNVPGGAFTADQFWQLNTTAFIDRNLNTAGGPYHYQIDFYVRGEAAPLGSTNIASSVFLQIKSTDNTNILSWKEEVPWDNYRYIVYRKNEATGQFDSIGFSTQKTYADKGLVNGKLYCYRVQSVGTYSIEGVVNPIFNWSQEVCGTPVDDLATCPVQLSVDNLCVTGSGPVEPPYKNELKWNNPNTSCPETDDARSYRIWYAQAKDDEMTLLETIAGAENTRFTHLLDEDLAGCYAISVLDSIGNESPRSNVVCVDNCPQYSLPNAFTPNGDNSNDLFTPFPGWRFIERIDLQIFNRWGNRVFQTQDPAINWNGKTNSGDDLAEGSYFYVCKVYERRVEGVVLRSDLLSGYIELVRGAR